AADAPASWQSAQSAPAFPAAAAAPFPSAGPAAPAPPVAPAPPPAPVEPAFVPANEVEANLLESATDGHTDSFLSTLLLAKVWIPVPVGASISVKPGDPNFEWRHEEVDGQPYVVVFTSPERMVEHLGPGDAVTVKFVQLIRI